MTVILFLFLLLVEMILAQHLVESKASNEACIAFVVMTLYSFVGAMFMGNRLDSEDNHEDLYK